MLSDDFGWVYLAALAGAVLIGAVLPILPTGAAVSAGAVLASHSNPIGLVGVLIAGAGGAYLGDLIVYAGCRAGGEKLAQRVGWLRNNASLDALRVRLAEHEITRALQMLDQIRHHLGVTGTQDKDLQELKKEIHPEDVLAEIERAQEADYITFTSSSTVTNLLEALGDRFPKNARVVSIGPVTSETARAAGLEVALEAERHDVDGLLDALLADAT